MVTTIKFTKMQGAGNDYIYVDPKAPHVLKLHTENELVEEVTVDMDLPLLANSRQINTPDGKMLAKTITVDGKEYKRTFVCM